MINLFGTDGIRGTIGTSPFTIYELEKLGRACAFWACNKYGQAPTILLGHDTRISCSFVKSAFKSGFLQFPGTIIDGEVLPTPAVCQIIRHQPNFNCGIIISASHNLYHDNGIKIIDRITGKLSEQDELYISELFSTIGDTHDYTSLGTETIDTSLQNVYKDALNSFFQPYFLKNTSIILDCAHGAMTTIAPKIFEYYGARLIVINNQPNGVNINKKCGVLYPQSLQEEVIKQKADFGFAFDGDGDRVIAVNHYGHIKNGDDILALLMQHAQYFYCSGVVGTIMSNKGLENFVTSLGKTFIRTAVGDKHVMHALQNHNYILGGEPSGHIILRDYLPISDGLYVALRILESVLQTKNYLMNTFNQIPQILVNIPVRTKINLDSPILQEIITEAKIALPEGRLIARYSGTEPCLRIMIENSNLEHAQNIAHVVTDHIKKAIS